MDWTLPEKAAILGDAAQALAELGEADPDMARDLGLEVASLETRMLLGSGCVERLAYGNRADTRDVARLTRLETLVRLAQGRVERELSSLDAEERKRPLESLAGAVSLAGGLFSIAKQIL